MSEHEYIAYGLRLTCSFELLGTAPAVATDDGLPTVALTLCDLEILEHAWSGATSTPAWQGRLGDGLALVMDEGLAGDILFTYGERARFLLDSEMMELRCAAVDDDFDWKRVLISKLLPTISVLRGYEGLHAAAIESPHGVVAILAPSGSGKSTLASELLGRGWTLFADDALILDDRDGAVRAYPGTPHMNLSDDAPNALEARALGTTLAMIAGERWLAASTTATQTQPVRMLCMLRRVGQHELTSELLPSSPLALTPYMLGLPSDSERERRSFCLYADLMQTTPLVGLTAGLKHRPGQLADRVECLLEETAKLSGLEAA